MAKRLDIFDHDTRDDLAVKGDIDKIKDKQAYHI